MVVDESKALIPTLRPACPGCNNDPASFDTLTIPTLFDGGFLDDKELQAAVNRSGFPLQIKVAAVIGQTQEQHGWRVLHCEHAWRSQDGRESGFIDLVLSDRYGTSVLVVECKRALKTDWIFLQTADEPASRRHCKTWAIHFDPPIVHDHQWIDLNVDPPTPESGFCVCTMEGQGSKTLPLLERIAADLTDSTAAFAWEQRPLADFSRSFTRVYASVVLTTARLKLCRFDVNHINLSDGTLRDAHFTDVPYVRFRKQLSTEVIGAGHDVKDLRGHTLSSAKESTVFVVQVDHLADFLADFEVSDESFKRLARS